MLATSSASNTYGGGVLGFGMDAANPVQQLARRFTFDEDPTPLRAQPHRIGVPMAAVAQRRIVQVFIADSNENVPLDDCVLYKGDQKLTDANDQELFFELDIKSILEAHNVKRIKMIDKKVKDRTEYLEPAKVRDLKMVVVTVASL
jgi:hypothetical protein